MHDSSLNVKAKQKEPAGNIPWKSVRREGLAAQIAIKAIFPLLIQEGSVGVLGVHLLFGCGVFLVFFS